MLNLDYPGILQLFAEYSDPKRAESACFLIWYLKNYYRLDSQEAVDAICDQRFDKGVDGIYVNDNDQTIDIFQSKISQNSTRTIGDVSLKEFYGTLSQFKTPESVQNIIDSSNDTKLVELIKREDIITKVKTHELRGIFLTNINIDTNGKSYLRQINEMEFVGKDQLISTYISDTRTTHVSVPTDFDITGFQISKYYVKDEAISIIAPVKAKELVKLEGISDQSIFAFNIRGPLGNTQVNKDIIKSIKNVSVHKYFPLFHNGITIICSVLEDSEEKITINDYYVVNGCQSLNSLFRYQEYLSDDLRILTRFVKMEIDSSLSEQVTTNTNNQNGVKARDFVSNNPIQIRLKNEINSIYNSQYSYEIKRGEISISGEVITNEFAGIYLWTFDLKEPWDTHRKYQVFEDKHINIFARPEVTADRIVLCHEIYKCIENSINKINNTLFGKYALTKFTILYIIRELFEKDDLGKAILKNPQDFIREIENRDKFKKCIQKVIDDIIVDINAEIDDLGDDFDYRSKLRDKQWVTELQKKVVSEYLKLIHRGRIDSLKTEWEK